jgi:hypothetical protein
MHAMCIRLRSHGNTIHVYFKVQNLVALTQNRVIADTKDLFNAKVFTVYIRFDKISSWIQTLCLCTLLLYK